MNLRHVISNLHLLERNTKWWRSGLAIDLRLAYYPAMAASFTRMAFRGGRRVRYLGRDFVFDNPATPMNLQVYCYEVANQILSHVDAGDSIGSVLDIGANCGQFTVSLKHFLPHARIDVIEPNTAVLDLLRRNIEDLDDVRVFPCALSPTAVQTLYYEPRRSCAGSLIRQNAGPDHRVTALTVTSADQAAALTGRTDYDLIKVDVEGYEFEVLQCLAQLRPRYLFLELSAGHRGRSYRHSQIWNLLRSMFGEFDILSQDAYDHRSDTFDVLIRFQDARHGAVPDPQLVAP